MRRYLALYAACIRFSSLRALEFRVDFFFRVLMDMLWYAMHLAFFGLLYRHTALLGGWDEAQVRIFAASLFVLDAVHMTFFSNNLWWFPTYVNRGDLDYHLVRPVSSLFFLSVRDVAMNSALNLLMALGILAWAVAGSPQAFPAAPAAAYVLALLLGALLHYALMMLFLVPVFWLTGSSGLRDMYWVLDRFVGRPDGLWTGWVRRLLTTLLPLALVVSWPVRVLVEPDPWPWLLELAAATAGALLVLALAWRAGLRAYGSASS